MASPVKWSILSYFRELPGLTKALGVKLGSCVFSLSRLAFWSVVRMVLSRAIVVGLGWAVLAMNLLSDMVPRGTLLYMLPE